MRSPLLFRLVPAGLLLALFVLAGCSDLGKPILLRPAPELSADTLDFAVVSPGNSETGTLVIGNQTYKLSLMPSGVVRKGKLGVIGNGVVIDPAKNAAVKATEAVISADHSKVKVFVIPTNEELVVARETKRLLEAAKN